jgi:nucleoside-diphosphate-sugar epimerase
MRVSIAGGHGQIALLLTRLLGQRGDLVRSIIRNPAHEDDVRAAGGEPVLCDLEAATEEEVADAVGSADAVVFAAGAGAGSGAARKETMDYGGAVKLIHAAIAGGIRRYVMVSTARADASAKGDDTFGVYLRAKGRADDELIGSGLDYTIVRPVRLTDEPGTGRVRLGNGVGRGTISRADVAEIVATALADESSAGKVFEAKAGELPVGEALRRL